ncbi:MAG: 30S ribosomal protein S3ae [Methanobacteriota archaeon]|nr:MAG: 30S ribosomal protein S3ae [Euryarchaeota archaeon]
MAEQPKKTRTSARKIKDRWKAKGWYNLLAPEMFNRQVLGETVADESGKVMGRIAEVTVQDLTGDFSKMHIKLHFKVHQIQGQDALTQFVGHAMTSDYVRRLTRRKRTRTDGTFDVTTKDAWKVRVKPMAIADRRIQSSKQRVIRQIMERVVRDAAANLTIGEYVKAMISGELAKNIAVACKPIQPITRVEIRQSEVQATGAIPEPAAAPAAAEAPVEPPAPEAPGVPAEMPAAGEPPAEEEEIEESPEELPPDDL